MLGKPIPSPGFTPYGEQAMAGRPPSGEAPLFGRRLASLRKERGLSQQELAKGLGVKLSLVAYYERRAKNPTLEVANKIARFFDVPISTLLDDEAPRTSKKRGPRSHLEDRFERLKKLPRAKQDLVMRMIDAVLAESRTSA